MTSRTSLKLDHLLQAPDSFVRSPLPGMQLGSSIIHAGPALGARFTEYTAELQPGGTLGPTSAQRFLYVVHGEVHLDGVAIGMSDYAFVPQGEAHSVTAISQTNLIVIEKPYQPLGAAHRFTGKLTGIQPQPLLGDQDVLVQTLVPDAPEFDFAVNALTFSPGAALPMVESHLMEHGLMMLEGGGIYRLGDHWYHVTAGDFIWMAPYCPQWFGAIGKVPAKYLIYKDWNRHPL